MRTDPILRHGRRILRVLDVLTWVMVFVNFAFFYVEASMHDWGRAVVNLAASLFLAHYMTQRGLEQK